jgi:hypothetical protein
MIILKRFHACGNKGARQGVIRRELIGWQLNEI